MVSFVWLTPDYGLWIGGCISRQNAIDYLRDTHRYGSRGDHHFGADRLKIVEENPRVIAERLFAHVDTMSNRKECE